MTRVLTAVIAIPLVLLVTIYSPNWLFAPVVGLVAAMAVEEFLSLGLKKGIGRPGRWFLLLPVLVVVSFLQPPEWIAAATAGAAIILMTVTVFKGPMESGLGTVVTGVSSIVYCSLTLGFLVLLPRQWILVLFAIIWVGDSAAYYGGRAFGRHLLAPKVSPKKTVEG